jgi:hypothetical protein
MSHWARRSRDGRGFEGRLFREEDEHVEALRAWRHGLKQVYVAHHPTEAHLVKGLLEANGITAVVRGESLFGARGEVPSTADTLPSVWVEDENEALRARDVMSEYERGRTPEKPDMAWICPACSERIEAQFTECWHCGAGRPGGNTE